MSELSMAAGRVGNPLSSEFLASLGLGALVPDALAHWRGLVLEGMAYFLQRLPEERRAELVLEQLSLGAGAAPAKRLVAVLGRCPTLHKMGQVIARHRGLDAALRAQLQTLEWLPPLTPVGPLLERIRREVPVDAGIELSAAALAEGSVAVIVPFSWREAGETKHGVFKVLKPGVARRLEEELAIWIDAAAFLEQRARHSGLPALGFSAVIESVRELLTREIRLDVEQVNMARAARLYRSEPRVLIPRLLPWCTPRVTAMERVFGAPVTAATHTAHTRRRNAATLSASLLAQPFWTRDAVAIFHADPHAGNLLATDDGRVAVIDWSLVASLNKAQREAMVDAALGALLLDERKVCGAIAALSAGVPQQVLLRECVARALQPVRKGMLPGVRWLMGLMDDLISCGAAGFRDDMVLFRKAWFTLSDVIDDVLGAADADAAEPVLAAHDPDAALIGVAIQRFFAEQPARLAAAFDSRHFDTHLSNAGLLDLWARLPFLPARYWLGS